MKNEDYETLIDIERKFKISRKSIISRADLCGVEVVKIQVETESGFRLTNAIPKNRINDVMRVVKPSMANKPLKSALKLALIWGVEVDEVVQTGEMLSLSPVMTLDGEYFGPHFSRWQQDRLRQVLVPEELDKVEKYQTVRSQEKRILSNHDLGLYSRILGNYVPKEFMYAVQ